MGGGERTPLYMDSVEGNIIGYGVLRVYVTGRYPWADRVGTNVFRFKGRRLGDG